MGRLGISAEQHQREESLVEVGCLENRIFKKRVVVVSAGWPSISLVLDALGCDVTTFTGKAELGLKVGMQWNQLEGHDPRSYVPGEKFSYWIQGSMEFVQKQMELVPKDWKDVIGIGTLVGRRIHEWNDEGFKRCTVSHSQMGGVTLGRFRVIIPNQASSSEIVKGSKVRRYLKHILDHTVRGFPQREGEGMEVKGRNWKKGEERVYDGEARIAPGATRVVISTHCVTQRGVRIKRYLSSKEIMDVYDVQSRVQISVAKLVKEEQVLVLSEIVQAVPEKVVNLVAREVIRSCLIRPEGDIMKWYKAEDNICNEEKAARNDDAEIDTEQWDRFVLRTYDPQLQLEQLRLAGYIIEGWEIQRNVRPKICQGADLNLAHYTIFNWLRVQMLQRFRRSVTSSFVMYLREKYGPVLDKKQQKSVADVEWLKMKIRRRNRKGNIAIGDKMHEELKRDLEQGTQAVTRASFASYWDWDGGSSLFFWRWPVEFMEEARDGTRPFVMGKLPRYRSGQRWPKDKAMRQAMEEKWKTIISRGYVGFGPVVSLTGSFPVPKGEDDIRMVYDATKCGLNEVLWAPNFFLPTIDTTLRHVDTSSWFGDIDLGEQFLNFSLHPSIRQYAGIDISAIKDSLKEINGFPASRLDQKGRIFMRWERCLMGLRSSPYNVIRATSWAEDVVRGNPLDKNNIFRWNRVVLNLPGMVDYDPRMPRGYKFDDLGQGLANNFETYVDDIRSTGRSEIMCAMTSRRIASVFNFLGIQDAARKRRFPSRNPGVWCGARTVVDDEGIYTGTTQAKWDRGKKIVEGWLDEQTKTGILDRKDMLKGRGFLVHLSRTYPGITPFLKGVHHTIENWRTGRNQDGWKFTRDDWRLFLSEMEERDENFGYLMTEYLKRMDGEPPDKVKGVRRLEMDLRSILRLMEARVPPLRLVRGRKLAHAIYGFGDASGAGFGSTWETKQGISYRFGVWGKDIEGKSSNYRELKNLVDTVRNMCKSERLTGMEI